MNTVLSLRGITLQFGGIAALSDVALDIGAGEIHSVIGPNGAGKSSLINVISGLYRPDAGTIRIGDAVLDAVPPGQLATLGVARTFQNIALFKGLSVDGNIAIGLTHRARATAFEQILGLPRARREARAATDAVAAVIAQLDLARFRDRAVASLPYGVQKRVELARALVAEPRILLLDEPMAGMTAGEKAEMSRFIRAARTDWQTTVVLVEHDMSVVMDLSDRVTVLDHGVRIAHGTPAEVQTNQAVIEAYLGVEEPLGAAPPREFALAG